jgi:hypothetical protein
VLSFEREQSLFSDIFLYSTPTNTKPGVTELLYVEVWWVSGLREKIGGLGVKGREMNGVKERQKTEDNEG